MLRFALSLAAFFPLLVAPEEPQPRRGEVEIVHEDILPALGEGWQDEVRLWDGSRVDLLGPGIAAECDWSSKWTEGVGQALYYSIAAPGSPRPVLILMVRDLQGEEEYLHRAQAVCARYQIWLWIWDVERADWIKR